MIFIHKEILRQGFTSMILVHVHVQRELPIFINSSFSVLSVESITYGTKSTRGRYQNGLLNSLPCGAALGSASLGRGSFYPSLERENLLLKWHQIYVPTLCINTHWKLCNSIAVKEEERESLFSVDRTFQFFMGWKLQYSLPQNENRVTESLSRCAHLFQIT